MFGKAFKRYSIFGSLENYPTLTLQTVTSSTIQQFRPGYAIQTNKQTQKHQKTDQKNRQPIT